MKKVKGIKTFNSVEIQYYKELLAFRRQIMNAFNKNINIKSFADADLTQKQQINNFSRIITQIIASNKIADKMGLLMYRFFNTQIKSNLTQSGFELDLESYYKSDRQVLDNLITNSEEYIKKYGEDIATWLRTEIRTNYLQGKTSVELKEQIQERFSVDKNKAKLIARNESSTFMGAMEKKRFQDLGVEEAIWQTVGDERVRSSHKHLNGKKFKLDKGLYNEKTNEFVFPKSEINCRCFSNYLIE